MKRKIKPLVQLNVNPCKMCMPMGSATAFYGIRNCMTILHGSQGCATYIRRHMATHYNEPVDIASSSLTEQGTVYGGSANLKKGLKNLIALYQPEVIGVMTTCLSETIGEDIKSYIEEFYEENKEYKDILIIPANSPGYGGTQYEGYFKALYSIVDNVEMNCEKNELVNVVTSPLSPADTRYLKEVFKEFGIDAILLPDLSENLDGVHAEEYSRLPHGGTSIEMVKKMGGARFTLELCGIVGKESAAELLFEKYQVPYKRLNLPTGLRDMDAFLNCLSEISGKGIPEKLKEERGRYVDAMIDSHKYNAAGRAVVFGEPDMILQTARMCCESGIMPVVCATGTVCKELKEKLEPEVGKLADMYYIDDFMIADNADFKDIEEMAKKYQANILIGNSDGRRMAKDLNLPLIRRGFPVHDHVGGQRLRMLGYDGSLAYLDEITNALIDTTEETFRENLYDTYYKGTAIDTNVSAEQAGKNQAARLHEKRTKEHPCFNCGAHKYARIHLPVAPQCNIQCNYCVRKYDCPNESRPGVTSNILTPKEALARYKQVKEKMPNLTVVGIAGPGDALANWEEVKQTLTLIKEYDSDVTFCLSTNGLLLPMYAKELAELGVTHVTVTLNAVDPHVSGQIYKYINYMGKRYEGDSAGAIMIANQLAGIRLMAAYQAVIKINIVTIKGINDTHIPEVVRTAESLGCYVTNIMQMISVKGSGFEHLETLTNKQIDKIRNECKQIMPQMYHCSHCRADAVGTLGNDISIDLKGFQKEDKAVTEPKKEKMRFAVASQSGVIVDMHFGQAKEFYLYDYLDGEIRFAGKCSVEKYCSGDDSGEDAEKRMEHILTALGNCNCVISMRIGVEAEKHLIQKGITAISTYDKVTDAVKKAIDVM